MRGRVKKYEAISRRKSRGIKEVLDIVFNGISFDYTKGKCRFNFLLKH